MCDYKQERYELLTDALIKAVELADMTGSRADEAHVEWLEREIQELKGEED